MKKFIVIVILFFTVRSQGQGFDNYYQLGHRTDIVSGIWQLPDSGYSFLNFSVDTVLQRQDMGISRIDKFGNEISKKKFQIKSSDFLLPFHNSRSALRISNSSVIQMGYVYDSCSSTLVKLNLTNTDTVACKYYNLDSGNVSGFYNSLLTLSPNHLLLVGQRGTTNKSWPTFYHLDTSLNLTRRVNIVNPNNFWNLGACYNPASNQILLSGNTPTPPPNAKKQPLTLMSVDTLGNFILGKLFSNPNFQLYVSKIIYSNLDSSYIICGSLPILQFDVNTVTQKMMVIKVDAKTLIPRWHYLYGDEAKYNNIGDIIIHSNGEISLSGVYSEYTFPPVTGDDQRGILIRLNQNGLLKWARSFNNNLCFPGSPDCGEYFAFLNETFEKGLITIGVDQFYYKKNAKVWVVKTDSLGCVVPGCSPISLSTSTFALNVDSITRPINDVGINENQIEFTISPNPSKGNFSIKTSQPFEPNDLVTVYDLSGRKICEEKINDYHSSYTLTTPNLLPGVYLVQFTLQQKVYRNKLIIE